MLPLELEFAPTLYRESTDLFEVLARCFVDVRKEVNRVCLVVGNARMLAIENKQLIKRILVAASVYFHVPVKLIYYEIEKDVISWHR